RCRMRVEPAPLPQEADHAFFTPQELEDGWRLGCRHKARSGQLVEVPNTQGHSAKPAPIARVERFRGKSENSSAPCFLAIDLGTTFIHWRLESAGLVLEGQEINPQAGAGCDIMSRIAAALTPQGALRLHELSRNTVRRISAEAALAVAQAPPASCLCLAANPTMTALFLGLDVHCLAAAPYALPLSGGSWEKEEGLPPVWIPPQIAPFIGGDISAGYAALALGLQPPEYPFLLADMGTNGEFLLALSEESTLAASVALGPALEGTSLRHGCEARPGAITSFSFTPKGLTAHRLPGSEQVPGITGTGYLSLLSCMKKVDALSPAGAFTPNRNPLALRLFNPEHTPAGESVIPLPHECSLYASDVEEILKAKAAFSLGIACLLEEAGLEAKDLAAVHLAGALGAHVDTDALEELGFLSPGMASRIHVAGNTSLEGAALLARSEKAREELNERMRLVRTLDLASYPRFTAQYISHMRFS
ncbi:ASKHA domain-containing protein, partial [Desulfovibrio sp. OttesenSCG-928-G15]|nr:ASKHA domain-containing protein [Desulfovibrio sp. OttesenSCG-928-G15]